MVTVEFPYIDSFQHFETIDSTNAEAGRFVQKHPGLNGLFVADEQTAGRGRSRRTWYSPPGQGLWWSLLLGRREWFPENPNLFSLYTGLITKIALEEWTSASLKLKWPNDIYANHKKIGGVLIESKWQGNQPLYYTIGIGINLYQQPEDFAPDMRRAATSLRQLNLKKEIHRPDLLAALVQHFFQHWELLKSPESFVKRWEAESLWLDEAVEIIGEDSIVEGIFRGVESTGQAKIETKNGIVTVPAGDLSLRKR
ncbi:MAG: biotin--[acetyl-CoA-carboxylase] ligase [Lentisphaeria bacterium]|nr:biotin--[acetyl-CoA-carboxylase] ligase [Candidatus Neomarinimicrobiota bacterium]MCF7841427.1 biotin--[acetyl-CoA-carboxylase] ligase [Lentisphaeria bacterium]